MADRGRDLKVAILSDVDKFDADQPAKQLDHLADTADTAARHLGDLDDAVRGNKIDRLGDDVKGTARKVEGAFKDIARESKSSFRKVEHDLEDVGDRTGEVKDEAKSNLSEVASSFQGDMTSAVDLVQGTLGGLATMMGPAGIVAAAAAVGVGAIAGFFNKSKEAAEEAKQAVSDWVQAYKDGLGQISEETVQSKLNEFSQDGAKLLKEYSDQARRAGVSITDYVRAKAGDVEATKRVKDQLLEQGKALAKINPQLDRNAAKHADQAVQMQKVAEELGITTSQLGQARSAWKTLDDATRAGITASVRVDIPTPRELDAINRRVRDGIGTIVIPVAPGQNRYENNANNSRYRY